MPAGGIWRVSSMSATFCQVSACSPTSAGAIRSVRLGEAQPGLRLVAAVAHHAVLAEGLAGRRRGQNGRGRRRRTAGLAITTLGREGRGHRQERDGAITRVFHFSRPQTSRNHSVAGHGREARRAGALARRRSGHHLLPVPPWAARPARPERRRCSMRKSARRSASRRRGEVRRATSARVREGAGGEKGRATSRVPLRMPASSVIPGSSVTPSPPSTIWISVVRLVASTRDSQRPRRGPQAAMAWSRRQCPSSSSNMSPVSILRRATSFPGPRDRLRARRTRTRP